MLIYDIKGEGLHATDTVIVVSSVTQATVTDIGIMQQQLRARLTANNDQPICDRASLPLENNLEHRD